MVLKILTPSLKITNFSNNFNHPSNNTLCSNNSNTYRHLLNIKHTRNSIIRCTWNNSSPSMDRKSSSLSQPNITLPPMSNILLILEAIKYQPMKFMALYLISQVLTLVNNHNRLKILNSMHTCMTLLKSRGNSILVLQCKVSLKCLTSIRNRARIVM